MGHALQLALADALVRWRRNAGVQRALPARVRPRGHLDAERRGEGARTERAVASRARPGGVRGARLGVAASLRRHDHEPVPAHGRVDGLPPRAVHDGRRLRARGAPVLRPSLEQAAISTGTTASSTGARSTRARSPISSSTTSKSTTSSSSSATRSPTAAGTSRSRPCGRRRSSPTSPLPCTRTTSATATSSARRSIVPFVERRVPVIADERVEPEFGTGALKVTPGPRSGGLRDRTWPRPPRADGDRRRRAHERRRSARSRASTRRRPALASSRGARSVDCSRSVSRTGTPSRCASAARAVSSR